jgi:peptidoglycan/xylan/chitin deacetylase (PgdA/CDA1 family)
MDTSRDLSGGAFFVEANQPWVHWRLLDSGFGPDDWTEAIRGAAGRLDGLPAIACGIEPRRLMADIVSECQFGPEHWCLSRPKRIYYGFFRHLFPDSLRAALRTVLLSRQRARSTLSWPIEDRYVRFQLEIVARLMAGKGLRSISHVPFWPAGKPFAFVLTHDIETDWGQRHARAVASLEERYGFRSSFNFVPEKYAVDVELMDELKARGFEVGVHGLKHDGKSFSSKAAFDVRVEAINRYLGQWGAVGFRSPMTHRNPEWMQALEIEYDSSFFDTDPYEPMPGGTMSIWPFIMGRFVELPYTLAQDHTLMVTLAEKTPRLWLEKVEFIRRHRGLALLNVHPDYVRVPERFSIYEDFLSSMSRRTDFWHVLPREAARWWRARSVVAAGKNALESSRAEAGGFPFAPETIRLADDGSIVFE